MGRRKDYKRGLIGPTEQDSISRRDRGIAKGYSTEYIRDNSGPVKVFTAEEREALARQLAKPPRQT